MATSGESQRGDKGRRAAAHLHRRLKRLLLLARHLGRVRRLARTLLGALAAHSRHLRLVLLRARKVGGGVCVRVRVGGWGEAMQRRVSWLSTHPLQHRQRRGRKGHKACTSAKSVRSGGCYLLRKDACVALLC